MSAPDPRKAQMILDLRRGGVRDARVIEAMERVPRDLFVPEAFRVRAYENVALPIGRHQTISQPLVVGMMTEALDVGERMKVLEIGTGSGYQAAVLAPLCRRLYTIERHKALLDAAEKRFHALRLMNITTRFGDGSKGWPEQAPFDRIIVTAAAVDVPPLLIDQLTIGGVMVIPVGDDQHDQRLLRVTRTADGVETKDLGAVRFVPFVEGKAKNY
ncbi:protein-L-isoaspartate(D-aspartate) O-methyltransferase [Varunaivibrio sulfuroxidans]|uniref:Protein-L-isoaspartate O-methyltransferase n=1 Tax=Varunaivibrio sulfuroxidans TaxID=1773489 RepID=A0A4R3J7B8_9PROT|nr:protein-L-isoaspartate(D-aspartate) O-methyltransferase [Varunaivibrio sulfuroxidans]TCS61317.1 protein-L-isoaspartate(D-aspartate) O-methyltransferase [Varunaivibrio sulfuroxidans]WES31069.1 protein-L-isoaspartate(D-aspartate) O-methyltransferase [Varunaivibrio sulfuroxidans]